MSSEQLSQRIERDIRQLIGDLQMQIVVLRAALELAQQPQQPHPGEPVPAPPPPPPQREPIPPQPEQDEPLPRSARTNGATPLRG
jgi:hypothetical protein